MLGKKRKVQHDYKEKRAEVWWRDGGRCQRCFHLVSLADAHCHHKNRRGMGGGHRSDDPSGLEILCPHCHAIEHKNG